MSEVPAGKLALIDADIVRYQAAAVSDSVSYCHPMLMVTQRYKKDILADVDDAGEDPSLIEKTITPEPVEFCLHTIKVMVETITEGADCTHARLFMTGAGNYRETRAVTHPYKGTRVTEKPSHFEAAGDYLKGKYGAEVIEGAEADDALGYEHLLDPDNTVLCSTDKDLLMIPGIHFSWSSTSETQKYFDYPYNTPFEVTPYDADKWFYLQLLMGDTVDNIKGVKGIGYKKALKMLEDDGITPYPYIVKEWYNIVRGAYEAAGLSQDFLRENADLLWIQRSKDQLWEPPV